MLASFERRNRCARPLGEEVRSPIPERHGDPYRNQYPEGVPNRFRCRSPQSLDLRVDRSNDREHSSGQATNGSRNGQRPLKPRSGIRLCHQEHQPGDRCQYSTSNSQPNQQLEPAQRLLTPGSRILRRHQLPPRGNASWGASDRDGFHAVLSDIRTETRYEDVRACDSEVSDSTALLANGRHQNSLICRLLDSLITRRCVEFAHHCSHVVFHRPLREEELVGDLGVG